MPRDPSPHSLARLTRRLAHLLHKEGIGEPEVRQADVWLLILLYCVRRWMAKWTAVAVRRTNRAGQVAG